MPKKLTNEEVVSRLKKARPDRNDDFSKFVYAGNHIKGVIICPEHGEYGMSLANYEQGHACPECAKQQAHNTFAKTTEQFVKEAKGLFPQYDYSRVNYINAKTKVEIICPEHGSFWKTPSMLLFKREGCPECSRVKKASNTEEFITKAKKIFPDYDYSKVNYYNKRTKVEIICPKHGSFFIKPNDLLNNHGCPNCSRSKNNELIDKYLTEHNIEHIMEYKIPDCKYKNVLPFDCYIPKFNLLIEYQGKQHYEEIWDHESLKERKLKDKIKKEFAENNGYNFLEITYKDSVEPILTKILNSYILIE